VIRIGDRLQAASLLAGVCLSLVLTYAIVQQSLVIGSYEGGWVYIYLFPFGYRALRVGVIVSLIAVALLFLPTSIRDREWAVVGIWMAAAFAFDILMRLLAPSKFEPVFVSDMANSFYAVTKAHGMRTVLRGFDWLRVAWPMHAKSNMPGKIIFLYVLELLSTNTAVLPWLVVGVSNVVGGAAMYLFVRDFFHDRRAALMALILYLVVPSKMYFFPLLNTVTPVFVLSAAWLATRTFRTSGVVAAALLGVNVYALALFEPIALIVGILIVAIGCAALVQGDISLPAALTRVAIAGAAFASVWVFMRLAFHFDLFHALSLVVTDGVAFNRQRPYGIWVRQDPLDFVFSMGVCQAVAFAGVLTAALTAGGSLRDRLAHPVTVFTLSAAAMLGVIDVMGVNRGEIVRLWIFLACLFQIPAALACARTSRVLVAAVLSTTIIQTTIAASMAGFVVP